MNYDGFERDNTKIFTDMLTVTEKIENYILENYGGKIDGAYGSSLGGSSDFDQGSKFKTGLLTMLVGPIFSVRARVKKRGKS